MLRTALTTTALALLLAGGASAQTTTTTPTQPDATMAAPAVVPNVKRADGYLASELIGKTVYNGMSDDAESIGSISDLILSAEGSIDAVVIGVGGFLGIGKKNVAIEYSLVQIDQRNGDDVLVVETTAEALKAQEEFDSAAYEPMPANADVKETKPATAEDLANAPVKKPAQEIEEAPTAEPSTGMSETAPPAATTPDEPAAGAAEEKPAD